MKILLFGGSGTIGSELLKLVDCFAPSSKEVDVRSAIEVDKVVRWEKPDCIVNLAGLASPPDCDTNPEQSYLLNVQSIKNICHSAAKHCEGIQVINAGSILEITNPSCLYSKHKAEAREIALQYSRLLSISHLRLCTAETNKRNGFLLAHIVTGVKNFIKSGKSFYLEDTAAPKWVAGANSVADAINKLINAPNPGTIYVGPRMSLSIEEIFCKITEALGLSVSRAGFEYRDMNNKTVLRFSECPHDVFPVAGFGKPLYIIPKSIPEILGI